MYSIFSGEKIYTDNRLYVKYYQGLKAKKGVRFNEFTGSQVWQNRKEKVR